MSTTNDRRPFLPWLALAACLVIDLIWIVGEVRAAPHEHQFTATATIVTDRRAKLDWQRSTPVQTHSRASAIAYCNGLSLSGTGWRLPTALELLSIVDETRADIPIDPNLFPSTPGVMFWTVTLSVGDTAYGWVVDFSTNGVLLWSQAIGNTHRVRCVRDVHDL